MRHLPEAVVNFVIIFLRYFATSDQDFQVQPEGAWCVDERIDTRDRIRPQRNLYRKIKTAYCTSSSRRTTREGVSCLRMNTSPVPGSDSHLVDHALCTKRNVGHAVSRVSVTGIVFEFMVDMPEGYRRVYQKLRIRAGLTKVEGKYYKTPFGLCL